MTAPVLRPWQHDVQEHVLLEYSKLKQSCPEGLYVTLSPGDQIRWHGVLFVREGPYSPAVLRFNIKFPPDYPFLPPVIHFTSDIFHPLVTPLTTYTYTTGSGSSDTVSATDEERLPPGGFSLSYGFPKWFGREPKSRTLSVESSRKVSVTREETDEQAEGISKAAAAIAGDANEDLSVDSPVPPQSEDTANAHDEDSLNPGILEVLKYLKRVFSEESALDNLPLEAAGNAGAWKAWRAYRLNRGAQIATVSSIPLDAGSDEWNWDGVWEDRVRRGIDNSTSGSVLFGGVAGSPDLIRFSNLDDGTVNDIRMKVVGRVPAAEG